MADFPEGVARELAARYGISYEKALEIVLNVERMFNDMGIEVEDNTR